MSKDEIRKMKALPVKRMRRLYRGDSIYVNVSYYNYEMVEMFVTFDSGSHLDNEYSKAGWDAFTRAVSVSDVSTDTLIKQMIRCSRQKDDLPAVVISTLREFNSEMRRMKAHGE